MNLQESELKGDKAVEAITSVEIESTEVETELSEKHKDILSQLTTEEIRAVMTSVMDEMVQGVQVRVRCLIVREPLNEINKCFVSQNRGLHVALVSCACSSCIMSRFLWCI